MHQERSGRSNFKQPLYFTGKQTRIDSKKQLITDPPQDGTLYFQRSGNVSQKSLFPQLHTSFCLVNPSGYQPHSMKAAAEENALGNRLGIDGSSDKQDRSSTW